MGVYLLHSSKPLVRSNGEEVRHYLGWCSAGMLPRRLLEHERGRHSAKIVQAFLRLGAELTLGNYWPRKTRHDEVQMKSNGHLSRFCLVCELEQLTREWQAMANRAASESEFDEVLRALSRCDPQPPSTSTPSTSNGS
jgi:hypothetical protein